MRRPFSQNELLQIFKLDEEIIDIETLDDGHVFPVVRAYDDGQVNIHFWCIHCRQWHIFGRGGPEAPYQEGRHGYAGHRIAHCTSNNSPYLQNGVVLHIIGRFDDAIRKKHRKGTPLYCPKCRKQYSAALNACGCGLFINRRRKSSHPLMAEKYQKIMDSKQS